MKTDEVLNTIFKMSKQVDKLNTWHEEVSKWMEKTDKRFENINKEHGEQQEELVKLQNDVVWILRIIFGAGSLGLLLEAYSKFIGG